MSTNKSGLVISLALPAILLSSIAWGAGPNLDRLADCSCRRDDARTATGDRCIGLNTALASKSTTLLLLGITFWAGYVRRRPTLSNVSLALLSDSSWNDFSSNAADLGGTVGATSPSFDRDANSSPAAEPTPKDALSIHTSSLTGEHSDSGTSTEND